VLEHQAVGRSVSTQRARESISSERQYGITARNEQFIVRNIEQKNIENDLIFGIM